MKYDFDVIQDRAYNHSAKYDERKMKFGTDKVIPLWIADMDFKTAQPVIDAMKARAEGGHLGLHLAARRAGPERRLRLRPQLKRLYAAQRRLPAQYFEAGHASAGDRSQFPVSSF